MDEKINVDFGGWIEKGFGVWKENILTLALSTLIGMCVTAVSIGILGGAMGAGLTMMMLQMHDKSQPKPQVGDLFKGFQFLVPTLLLLLIGIGVTLLFMLVGMIPCLGQILTMAGGFILGTALLFVMCFIVDKHLPVIDAIKASIAIVKRNFWAFLGFYVVVSAISGAGFLLCCIGIFASAPIAGCIIVVAYRTCAGGGVIDVTPVEPPAPPAGDTPAV